MRQQHTPLSGRGLNLGPKQHLEEWYFLGEEESAWIGTLQQSRTPEQNPQVSRKVFTRNWTASLPTQKAKTHACLVTSTQNWAKVTRSSVVLTQTAEELEILMANTQVTSWCRLTKSPVLPFLNIEQRNHSSAKEVKHHHLQPSRKYHTTSEPKTSHDRSRRSH